MKFNLIVACSIVALAIFQNAHARDDQAMFPIIEVMEMSQAKEKLDGVNFYFGSQSHPAVAEKFGKTSTNKKTNAFMKSDEEACSWVFLSALVALHNRAQSLGGNAVINIKSNYKNHEVSSETEFECGAGNVIAGVALKGEVVRLSED